jgi:1-deoxy-D-xylulose-5-phosphate reductoisomerase
VKRIAILGSTGSIGRQTLDIARAQAADLKVVALAAGAKNLELLCQQATEFKPELICVPTAEAAKEVARQLGSNAPEIAYGEEGLIALATHGSVETLVTAVVGFLGLKPTAAAVRAGKTIALANKETLVAAGSVIMPMAKQYGANIVPVDSEHSAIFQSLSSYQSKDIKNIWLTGSGGPFRTWDKAKIAQAKIEDALRHPNWAMGAKITIDSATLMNKGLEVIEARWLFDIEPERIRVIIHPQSILHSAVEFVDNSVVGQMGLPDMRLPIHFAIFYPERVSSVEVPPLNLIKLGSLTFEEPDFDRFPCLRLAKEVASKEDTSACVLNAANEIAVDAFLKGRIKFMEIPELIERVLNKTNFVSKPSLEQIIDADEQSRKTTSDLMTAITTR